MWLWMLEPHSPHTETHPPNVNIQLTFNFNYHIKRRHLPMYILLVIKEISGFIFIMESAYIRVLRARPVFRFHLQRICQITRPHTHHGLNLPMKKTLMHLPEIGERG